MRGLNVSPAPAISETQRRLAAPLAAAVLGLFVLFVTGLAQPDFLHNAAHDSRHSFAFPCH